MAWEHAPAPISREGHVVLLERDDDENLTGRVAIVTDSLMEISGEKSRTMMRAIDAMAFALIRSGHVWSDEEAALYDAAVRLHQGE